MPPTWTARNYPPTRRSDHLDVYTSASKGKVLVPDPYQWLEENTDEVDKWMSAQASFTQAYLDQNEDRKKLEDKFRASMNYPKFSAPTLLDDGHWYWFYNSGLQAQSVLYRSKEPALPDFSKENNEVGEVFIDPNVLAPDGSAVMVACRFSRCGKYFAYAISHLGSDFSTMYVRPTSSPLSQAMEEDGRFPDEVKWIKFSNIAWTTDSKRYPARVLQERYTDRDAMICYHVVGTSQSEDTVVYVDKANPDWMFGTDTSEDGRYLYLYQYKDTSKTNLMWVAELDERGIHPGIRWRKLIDEYIADYSVVTNHGPLVYGVKTNLDAPQHKVVTIDLSKDDIEVRDFIPQAKDEIYLHSKTGVQLARLAEDFIGTASITNREKQPHFFLALSGFNSPGTIARYDFTAPETQRFSILRTTKVNGLKPEDFESMQVWYESKDGTKVPMFIVRHKSTEFDGTALAIQYGYGGFASSVDPFFNPIIFSFMQMYGAILAVPNIRGGGEFGEEWHRGGRRENKGNCVDDFIAAAQFLVKNKYAAPGKVVINGASNGGLLVCASVVRAPEGTFGAAVAEGSVADLLKFYKFTAGKAWMSEYGDPRIPEEFDYIYPLSPVHNVASDKVLPATLLMITEGDDRVVPMHSLKFIATLQYNLPLNPNPLLIRIDKTWLGHGGGKSTDRRIKDAVDKWGFVVQSLGVERRLRD